MSNHCAVVGGVVVSYDKVDGKIVRKFLAGQRLTMVLIRTRVFYNLEPLLFIR